MKIYICGDSTAASYPEEMAPLTGWGQLLGGLTGGIPVENRAMAGRSTKSFLAEGRLQAIEAEIRPSDLLLIQFTHNDCSPLVWRHTDPWTSFRNNLALFVDTALQCKAQPVLMTPLCRRYWHDGELQPSHGDYPAVIRMLAMQRNVPLIEMYEESFAHVKALGDEGSRPLFMHLAPGEYPGWPDGSIDDTHTRREGAEAWAHVAADGLKRLGMI